MKTGSNKNKHATDRPHANYTRREGLRGLPYEATAADAPPRTEEDPDPSPTPPMEEQDKLEKRARSAQTLAVIFHERICRSGQDDIMAMQLMKSILVLGAFFAQLPTNLHIAAAFPARHLDHVSQRYEGSICTAPIRSASIDVMHKVSGAASCVGPRHRDHISVGRAVCADEALVLTYYLLYAKGRIALEALGAVSPRASQTETRTGAYFLDKAWRVYEPRVKTFNAKLRRMAAEHLDGPIDVAKSFHLYFSVVTESFTFSEDYRILDCGVKHSVLGIITDSVAALGLTLPVWWVVYCTLHLMMALTTHQAHPYGEIQPWRYEGNDHFCACCEAEFRDAAQNKVFSDPKNNHLSGRLYHRGSHAIRTEPHPAGNGIFTRDTKLLIVARGITTAVTLAWLFYELGRHRYQQALDELLDLSLIAGRWSDTQSIECEYLNAGIHGTLRLHAVGRSGKFRSALREGLQVDETCLSGGTLLRIPSHTANRAVCVWRSGYIHLRALTHEAELVKRKKCIGRCLLGQSSCVNIRWRLRLGSVGSTRSATGRIAPGVGAHANEAHGLITSSPKRPIVDVHQSGIGNRAAHTTIGMVSRPINQCAACADYYDLSAISDPHICPCCEYYMDETAPKNPQEQYWNDWIKDLDAPTLRSLGLGDYYLGLDCVHDPQPNPQPTMASMSRTNAVQQASNCLRHRNTYYDTDKSAPNRPQEPQAPQTASRALSIGAPPRMPATPTSTFTMGYKPYKTSFSPSLPQQAIEVHRLQQRDAYFLSRGLDATELLRGRRTARQAHEQLYIARSVTDSSTPATLESVDEEPVTAAPKKRGKRMICATCLKDAPVNKDNDGVNCTKCYKKILKAQ
ncbi:hypothetical protein DOTSEDRAFT_37374 [Dothistroma septosporum NZE10]|uniref:Uncharacterized protein n=1 Tax=Dothistroma septosporum (strain NZE10 / CBS 128990) TaxID=675120 RepID=N1PEM9_DOTSN|nr:hypothetical protein DOTSEDRAFT_37374 [Dothistroma septosporum NZE10]